MGALPRIGYASPIAVAPRGVGLSPSPRRGKFKMLTGDSSACIFQNAVMLEWGVGILSSPTPSSVCMISKTSFIKLRQSHHNVINHSCYLKIAKNGLKFVSHYRSLIKATLLWIFTSFMSSRYLLSIHFKK